MPLIIELMSGLMRAELERGMKLMGCQSIKQLPRANLRLRS
jgi:L-lactate dehydrogenase (cytochrome)